MKILKATAPCISLSLSIALLLTGLAAPCPAQNTQNRVIVVNADQPNVWTLEQAHYLLAQMHRRNLDLKAKSLEDLDPNEINGLRFEVMRMLIEFGATFNQADLATNRMFSQNQEFNSQRRRDLTAQGDDLRKESISLAAEIDELENKRADAESDEEKAYQDVFFELSDDVNVAEPNLNSYLAKNHSKLSNRLVRTVDLIPRQSSLNVNDMKLKTTAGAFTFVLSTLFGFGSSLDIQRQREQFAQFVQQELYSSAFGKGSREFGWTFTPMPGMDRLQSGVRTTYAVIVVPDDATSLVLEANGCYFPRSAYQPLNFAETKDRDWNDRDRTSRNCGGQRTKAFVVPIPTATIHGTNDFWVNRISYQPVEKGKRIVVLISGQNFSSQIGVLINGMPLRHSIGMAQPLIRDDSNAGRLTEQDFQKAEIQGQIERIDANKIVFSFAMPEDYEGTPAITLVAPGKAIDLNWLTNIGINNIDAPATLGSKYGCQTPPTPGCAEVGPKMFFGDSPSPFRIDKVEAFRRPNNRMNVLIHGAGFDGVNVFINGLNPRASVVSGTLISAINIPATLDDQIQITLAKGTQTIRSSAIVNPLQLKIDNVTVISYEEATNRKPGGTQAT